VLDPLALCLCRFSRLVSRFHRCPPFQVEPAAYLDFLIEKVRAHGYDVVFPTHDQVYLLARFRDRLSRKVRLAVPDFDAIRRLQSKSEFVRTLGKLDMPLPPTQIVRSIHEVEAVSEFPCYVKLPHSTAGTGVRLVRSRLELRRATEEFERAGRLESVREIVVQRPATGIPSVVQALFQQGQLAGAHCAETILPGVGGGQGFRTSASHPVVIEHVRRLGEHLQWHGALFLEYFYDGSTGRPQYIEANPRIGETVNATLAGVNLCDLLVRISLGEKVEPAQSPRMGVRSHVGFLLLVAAALGGASRRQILRQLWHLQTRTGVYRGSHNEITRPGEDWASIVPAGATVLQLLAAPRLAHNVVKRSVDSYALLEAGALAIEQMSEDSLADHLRQEQAPTRPPREIPSS
jgi:predicted ATP-grasp superfamily ATP-dependent carboligase